MHFPFRLLWRAWVIGYTLLAVLSLLMYARTAFLDPASYGGVASASLGANLIRTTDPGRIDVIVRGLKPNTPLARAGVHEGDRLRLDIRWNDFRVLATGETFGFTRVAPGKPRHMEFVVPEFQGHAKDVGNYRYLITLFDLGVGLLLLVRAKGDLGVEALGMAFVAATISSNFPTAPGWAIFWTTLAYAGVALAPFLILAFAMSFYGRHTRPLAARERIGYGVLIAGLVAGFLVNFLSNYYAVVSPAIRATTLVLMVEVLFAYLASIAYLARGFALSTGSPRARYGLLLIALLLTFCLTAVQTYSFLVLKLARMDPENPLYDVNVVLSLAGPLLFAYAVLRHKVIDIGFVINRTLVYGSISVIMLSAFALLEWAVGHVLQLEGRNANAVLDAAIAVLITLSFTRVHAFVERYVEALFFRSWHENETRLSRFVADAGFVTREETLKGQWARELARFTGGAPVGLYFEGAEGNYRAFDAAPAFPATLDRDEPALVAMRAQRRAIDPAETASALAAALALPMLHRGQLFGFVVLGPKPSTGAYRPDEVSALSHAAHQVGLDTHALKIDALEREGAELRDRLRTLEQERTLTRAFEELLAAGRLAHPASS